MRKLYIFGLITLAVIIIGLAFADQMTISTYYPAPYGVYREFTTTSKTCLATNPSGTDTNARVGIGTTEPNCKLVLREQAPSTYDPVNVTPETHLATLWIRGQSATDGAGLAIFAYPDTYAGMRSDYMQDTAMIYAPSGFDNPALGTKNLQITAADANGEIIFHTGGWGTTTTERMRIDSAGNVGIGTTSPQETSPANDEKANLDVNDVYLRSVEKWASQAGTPTIYYAIGNDDISVTSPNWVDMKDMVIDFPANFTGGRVYLHFNAAIRKNARVCVRLILDGAQLIETPKMDLAPSYNASYGYLDGPPVSLMYVIDNLSSGAHTIKVQWKYEYINYIDYQDGAVSPRVLTAIVGQGT